MAKGQKTLGRGTTNMNVNSLAGTPMYMVKYKHLNTLDILTDFYLGTRSHYR